MSERAKNSLAKKAKCISSKIFETLNEERKKVYKKTKIHFRHEEMKMEKNMRQTNLS